MNHIKVPKITARGQNKTTLRRNLLRLSVKQMTISVASVSWRRWGITLSKIRQESRFLRLVASPKTASSDIPHRISKLRFLVKHGSWSMQVQTLNKVGDNQESRS